MFYFFRNRITPHHDRFMFVYRILIDLAFFVSFSPSVLQFNELFLNQ